MLVGTAEPGSNGSDEWLYAAPVPASGEPGGMSWYATVSPPAAPVTFGAGQLQLVQIVTIDAGYSVLNGDSYTCVENGQPGLDTSCPYPWIDVQPPTYATNDNPGLDLTSLKAVSAYLDDQFEDYLMYEPPGSGSQWVTVGHFVWSTNGFAYIPSTHNWADYGQYNLAGTVDPSSNAVKFAAGNTFPSWTQNAATELNDFH